MPGCSSVVCNHRAACYLYSNSTSSSCKFTSNLCTKTKRSKKNTVLKINDNSGLIFFFKGIGNFNGCKTQSSKVKSPMGYFASSSAKKGEYVLTTDDSYCQA